jgi:predicted dehydrogenase
MKEFRFAVLGAGNIAGKFCKAVALIDDCDICAVASKSIRKAEEFANRNGIEKYYDSYEELLECEAPDCAYISVTTNDHYRLTALCVSHGIPVLCEKAMFQNTEEARNIFKLAGEHHVFVMEAMWSRYLPAVRKVRQWIESGEIGSPEISQFSIGFAAPDDKQNRYFNPQLGGGAAKDITVYAYELTTYILKQKIRNMSVSAVWGDTGVDINNHISIDFEHTLADLTASLTTRMEEKMVIYGRVGKIILPRPHLASECYLYDENGELKEHFVDSETENGFTYEIEDVMQCIRAGKLESDVVPWNDTMEFAEVLDRIDATKPLH